MGILRVHPGGSPSEEVAIAIMRDLSSFPLVKSECECRVRQSQPLAFRGMVNSNTRPAGTVEPDSTLRPARGQHRIGKFGPLALNRRE